jgi:hypothetical protein
MTTQASSAGELLARAEDAWGRGDGERAMTLFTQAGDAAEADGEFDVRVAAVLGLARGQRYNLTPGRLPVQLHEVYVAATRPASQARLAAALARCWSYANEPARARPFALQALDLASGRDDEPLLADALDAALTSHWGPDDLARRRDWAMRLDDAAAHLRDPSARLQAHLWGLTVAWEMLDLPRMHRWMRAIEVLGDESPRARFFAASRRLPLELLRSRHDAVSMLLDRAETAARESVIPDAFGVLHSMRGYAAYLRGDVSTCAAEAVTFETFSVEHGLAAIRAEAAIMWLGAGRLDKVAELVGAFTPEILAELPRDNDWLLTLQCLLEGAIAVSDRTLAAALVEMLRPYAGRSVVNGGAVMWHGVTDDTLARGLALLGEADAARRHHEAALATYRRIGAIWWHDRLVASQIHSPAAIEEPPLLHLHEQPGGLWLVGREGATFVLPSMRGLRHLHRLLRSPGRDVAALTLMGGDVVEQPGLDVLDDRARRAYRARLAELDTEADEPERAWLLDQLATATGLSGRPRTSGSSEQRARVAVRKAIVAALARIAETDPWLGRHLHDRVRTGFVCRYDADPDHPVRWLLDESMRTAPSKAPRPTESRTGDS